MKIVLILPLCCTLLPSHAQPFSLVADTRTALPDGPGHFTSFSYAAMHSGVIAFTAAGADQATGNQVQGLFTLSGASLSLTTEDILLDMSPDVLMDSGTIAYRHLKNNLFVEVVLQSQAGEFPIVATTNSVPFGTGTFNLEVHPYALDRGFVAFSGLGSSAAGIYLSDGNRESVVVDRSMRLPGVDPSCGLNFHHADDMDYQADRLAFIAQSGCYWTGVYTWMNQQFKVIADFNSVRPPAGKFTGFGQVQIDGTEVYFLSGPVDSASTQGGIYVRPVDASGPIRAVVDSEALIPGTNRRFSFQGAGDFSCSDGLLVFHGRGPQANDEGLYSVYNGAIGRVIGRGDILDGKTVESLRMGPQGVSRGGVVFIAGFADGSRGVYTGTIAPALGPGGQIRASPGGFGGGGFNFTFTGVPYGRYRIEYTESLLEPIWQTLAEFVFLDDLTIHDPTAVGNRARWYRAVNTYSGPPPNIGTLQSEVGSGYLRPLGETDYLLRRDTDQFTFLFNYQAGPTLDLTITAEGAAAEFLNFSGTTVVPISTGESKTLIVQARPLENLIATTAVDRLYAARLRFRLQEPGNGAVVWEKSVYVFRYLDVADSEHFDGAVEFPRTTTGVTRRRPVDFHFGGLNLPNVIQIPQPGGSFSFDPTAHEIRFRVAQPVAVNGFDEASLSIVSPNGVPLEMKLRGEQHVERIYVDEGAFRDTLRRLALPTDDPERLTWRGLTLFEPTEEARRWLATEVYQQAIFNAFTDKLATYLAPFSVQSGGFLRTQNPAEADIVIDCFHSQFSRYSVAGVDLPANQIPSAAKVFPNQSLSLTYGPYLGSSSFSPCDLLNFASLADKLRMPETPISIWLRSRLSDRTVSALLGVNPSAAFVLTDINAILQGPSIYTVPRFRGIALRPETQQLLAQNPQGAPLYRLNRMLLEDAYPEELLSLGSLSFSGCDFYLPELSSKLKLSDDLATYIRGQLNDETVAALIRYPEVNPSPVRLRTLLTRDLNALISRRSLYEGTRFANINLSLETRTLLAQNPQGEDRKRLNRLLLQDAYPTSILRIPDPEQGMALFVESDNQAPFGGAEPVRNLVENPGRFNSAERNFRLARALNQRRGAIELYLEYVINPVGPTDRQEISTGYYLARMVAHEIGHQLGLLDTTFSGGVDFDLDLRVDHGEFAFQGRELMDFSCFGETFASDFLNGVMPDPAFIISAPALKMALGLDWDSTTADNALHYFDACLRARVRIGGMITVVPGLDFGPIPLFHYPNLCPLF